jgi:SpoVK/Ycf46/Vps4 family AAA+-type ATPase
LKKKMLTLKKQNRNAKEFILTMVDSVSPSPGGEPFEDVPATPAGHFDLFFLAATAQLTGRAVRRLFGTREATFEAFPFLQVYDERLAGREPDDLPDEKAPAWWEKALLEWEKNCRAHLPLRDLREKFGLAYSSLILLMTAGLIEEDSRFGAVFESLNEASADKRLTFGMLSEWQREEKTDVPAHSAIYELHNLGLIQFGGTENPRSEWTLQISILLWDVLRGEKQFGASDWVKYTAPTELLSLEKLILPAALRRQLALLPKLIERGDIQSVIVRGAHHNSRKTILGALAHALDLGLLETKNPEIKDDERWKMTGTLAVLLKAMPIFPLDVAPSERVEFPAILPSVKVFGVTLGKQGGVGGSAAEKAVTLTLNLPEESERREHWKDCLDETETADLDEISERFRLSGGNIRRAAALAKSYAVLANREKVTTGDVRQATRALNRQALDTLAIYLEPLAASWNLLAVREETMSDLRQLEERCRIRENLRNHVGRGLRDQLQAGVRGLFNGASGTGKTYAARLLAAALQKDVYRLDLSSVVNKYIGETEKNLARIFALVEELDVILLLDEGDALLTQRTSVSTANDRYANLETNYLLQRLESFEGILFVTTNANDRIDSAFQRRMDTVIEFAMPEAAERWRIWQLHLPENNAVSSNRFEEIVNRCELSGGQIRNVALHAAALALGEKITLYDKHLEAAVRREYRKTGAICPLRESLEANSNLDRW